MNPETRIPIGNPNLPLHAVARINNIQKAVSLVECAIKYSPIDQRSNIHETTESVDSASVVYPTVDIDPEANRIASLARQYAEEQHNQFPLPEHLRNRAS